MGSTRSLACDEETWITATPTPSGFAQTDRAASNHSIAPRSSAQLAICRSYDGPCSARAASRRDESSPSRESCPRTHRIVQKPGSSHHRGRSSPHSGDHASRVSNGASHPVGWVTPHGFSAPATLDGGCFRRVKCVVPARPQSRSQGLDTEDDPMLLRIQRQYLVRDPPAFHGTDA